MQLIKQIKPKVQKKISNDILQPIRVLLIEDNELYADGLSNLLETRNIDVNLAISGEKALEVIHEFNPEVIVMEIMIGPYIDGYSLLTTLKQDLRTAHIPVILISTMNFPDKIEKGLELGANDYLVKPFNSNELVFKILSLVKLRDSILKYQDISNVAGKIGLLDIDQKLASDFSNLVAKMIANNIDTSIPEITKQLNVGYAKLETIVKKFHQCTPVSFILTKRLERADLLLRNSNINISNIALATGFKSTSYFCTAYKKHFGKSALANRNSK